MEDSVPPSPSVTAAAASSSITAPAVVVAAAKQPVTAAKVVAKKPVAAKVVAATAVAQPAVVPSVAANPPLGGGAAKVTPAVKDQLAELAQLEKESKKQLQSFLQQQAWADMLADTFSMHTSAAQPAPFAESPQPMQLPSSRPPALGPQPVVQQTPPPPFGGGLSQPRAIAPGPPPPFGGLTQPPPTTTHEAAPPPFSGLLSSHRLRPVPLPTDLPLPALPLPELPALPEGAYIHTHVYTHVDADSGDVVVPLRWRLLCARRPL